jgi:hypothetical protein
MGWRQSRTRMSRNRLRRKGITAHHIGADEGYFSVLGEQLIRLAAGKPSASNLTTPFDNDQRPPDQGQV